MVAGITVLSNQIEEGTVDNQRVYPRSPRDLMDAIRKEYQASHGDITRNTAERRLSEQLGWRPNRWGNIARGNTDFEISMVYEMIAHGIIDENSEYHYELLEHQAYLDKWIDKHGRDAFEAFRKAAEKALTEE